MKHLFFMFFAALVLTSCNKESLLTENTHAELLSANHEESNIDQLLTNAENNINVVSSLRNGTQRINDNQTDDALQRGIGVPIPLFSEETVVVKTGSWVTLRFGLQDLLIQDEFCPEELSEELINSILENAVLFEEDADFAMYFDGEPIEIAPHYRTEGIRLVYGTTSADGTGCYSQIPWRYYLNPQSKGDHEFKVTYGENIEYTRIIRWENLKEETE